MPRLLAQMLAVMRKLRNEDAVAIVDMQVGDPETFAGEQNVAT
jgi:hypothetical protein